MALETTFRDFPALLGVGLSEPSRIALGRLREYSLRPGKRIRGSLAAVTFDEAAGTHLGQPGIQLGVVLELMQNYLLIIDDVMDKSAVRRGEPTVHELYLQQTDPKVDLHEAQMMAINVGQLAQHMACLVLANIDVDDAYVRQATQLLHRNIVTTGIGQIDDLYQQIGRDVSDEDILRKYQCKSSYYTFINPLQCGFALAGKADESTLEACRQFGLPAGVAFQLHDDRLGIFADSKVLGKPNLDDIREGKYTLLMQYSLRHASAADVTLLKAILGKAIADEADLSTVREILERSGSVAFVQQETELYADEAHSALAAGSWSKSFVTLLNSLVEFSIRRQA